jgi:5'-3' exoribonuclease 1
MSVFAYVEHLFAKIKPKKLFMAVDGVAPRAKMNQRRSRRFWTAKVAKEIRDKRWQGKVTIRWKGFDSSCIAPGTSLPIRTYPPAYLFISWLVSQNICGILSARRLDWREIQVVLSGHEVPGEGEHKIMVRSRTTYNPNVRRSDFWITMLTFVTIIIITGRGFSPSTLRMLLTLG